MSCLIQSHQVFFGHPLCLILSTSHDNVWPSHYHLFVQHVQTISTNSFWSSNWLVPISEFFTFLPFIQLNPNTSIWAYSFQCDSASIDAQLSRLCLQDEVEKLYSQVSEQAKAKLQVHYAIPMIGLFVASFVCLAADDDVIICIYVVHFYITFHYFSILITVK